MPPQLQYPDLVPPQDWTYFRAGPQVRLIPPGTRPENAPCAIIVSPIVPRLPQMPGLEQLVTMAIEAEAKLSFEITEQKGPAPVTTPTGLEGVTYELSGYARPSGPVEKRVYVLVGDAHFIYGINYLASPATFADNEPTFWAVANSIRPFEGRAVPAKPVTAPPHPDE